jgi:hypothetical protein
VKTEKCERIGYLTDSQDNNSQLLPSNKTQMQGTVLYYQEVFLKALLHYLVAYYANFIIAFRKPL